MIKQIIYLCSIAIAMNSCNALYTTPAAPHTFLEKKEGLAINGGLGTNVNTNFVQVGASQAVTSELTLNASTTLSYMGNNKVQGNPFAVNSAYINQFAINAGLNTRKVSTVPFQLWFGVHGGGSGNTQPMWKTEPSTTSDVKPSLADTFTKFQRACGNYIGFRFGFSHYLYTNYDGDLATKALRKTKFDIIGTGTYTPISYNFSNGTTVTKANNVLIGYGANMRVYQNKWMLNFNLDNMITAKQLTDEILGNKSPKAELTDIPVSIPTLGFSYFINRK
jgi:hypothetical protein